MFVYFVYIDRVCELTTISFMSFTRTIYTYKYYYIGYEEGTCSFHGYCGKARFVEKRRQRVSYVHYIYIVFIGHTHIYTFELILSLDKIPLLMVFVLVSVAL